MRLYRFLMLVVVATLLGAPPARAETLLRNLRVVDVEAAEVSSPRDVFVREGRIAWIREAGAVPEGAEVYDAGGGYAIPGLWDSHVHVFTSPEEPAVAFPMYLLNGVTGIRDMGALLPLDEQKRIARALERGEMEGPRVILSGAWVDAPPGSWPGMFLAATPQEARAVVDRIAGEGWAAVKSYSMLGRETYLALADQAEARGLPLVGHVPEAVTLGTAIGAGQKGIEHWGRVTKACSTEEARMIARVAEALEAEDPRSAMIAEMQGHNAIVIETWDAGLCRAVVDRLAAAGVHVSPTLVVSDFYTGVRPDEDALRMRLLPTPVREGWQKPDFRLEAMTDELRELAGASIALDMRTFRLAHEAGVPVLASTDASFANPFIFHGFSLIDELERYVAAGLSPRDALHSATVAPARFFDLPEQDGRLAAGRRADIVILQENPLEALSTLRRPRAVMANGRLYDRAALDALAEGLLAAAE